MFNWSTILPQPNNSYSGSKISLYYLVLLSCMFTFRGVVHYFVPDGGSGIIAGIPLETYPEGAVQSIITGFGVYGIYHLIPIFLLFVGISQLMGIILLTMKPLPVIPPGQIGVYLLFPITLVAFLLSIRQAK